MILVALLGTLEGGGSALLLGPALPEAGLVSELCESARGKGRTRPPAGCRSRLCPQPRVPLFPRRPGSERPTSPFLLPPAEARDRVWYDIMEGQHNHPHHLGDQNNPLCKLPGQEFQHDPQVSAGVSDLSPSVFSYLHSIKVSSFLSI